MNPDGIFLSYGPGDPEPCDYAIQALKKILDTQDSCFWYLVLVISCWRFTVWRRKL